MAIRILKPEDDKRITRPLYEAVFSDGPRFVDYYYREICAGNTVLCKLERGRPIAMLHLNPHRMMFCGSPVTAYYVVAVATVPERRHEGHMADLLRAAAEYARAQQAPFLYLMPVDERIYAGQSFFRVCDFSAEALPYAVVQQSFDLYCVQTEQYLRRRAEETAILSDEASEELPEHPVMMFRITDCARFGAVSGLAEQLGRDPTEAECIAFLREKRIYLAEEV